MFAPKSLTIFAVADHRFVVVAFVIAIEVDIRLLEAVMTAVVGLCQGSASLLDTSQFPRSGLRPTGVTEYVIARIGNGFPSTKSCQWPFSYSFNWNRGPPTVLITFIFPVTFTGWRLLGSFQARPIVPGSIENSSFLMSAS